MKKLNIPAAKLDERFNDLIYTVEADSFASHRLWTDYSNEYKDSFGEKQGYHKNTRYEWKQDSMGFTHEVGCIKKLPIMFTFFFYNIDGYRVGFYDAHSLLVHHGMVKDWINKNIPRIHEGGARWGDCDAQNFHHCLHEIDRRKKASPLK